MKKSLMKKAFAALTAVMTTSTLAISLGSSAANTDDLNSGHAHLITSSVSATIPVKKDIVAFNPAEYQIHEPNIVYTYDITPANFTSSGAKIRTKDSSNQPIEIDVHKGELAAIIGIGDEGDTTSNMVSGSDKKTGTITFGKNNTETAKKVGNKETATTINVNEQHKFTHLMNIAIDANWIYNPEDGTTGVDKQKNPPGVYRYKIEDVTAADTFIRAGVDDGGAGNSLYLDVYTKYNTAQDGLVIYGYVLFREDTTNADTSIEYTEQITPSDEIKTEGFVTSSEGDDDENGTLVDLADASFDTYKTYNVRIEKAVEGDLADRHHQFPFEVKLSNAVVTSLADFTIMDTNGSKVEYALDASGNCSSNAFKLAHGESVTLIGLPKITKVMVTEENDKDDVYTASAYINDAQTQIIKDADASTAANSIALDKGEKASLKTEYEFNTKGNTDVIKIKNTLSDVSVTGLLFSIAPFVFITLAGAALLIFVLRSRRPGRDDSII